MIKANSGMGLPGLGNKFWSNAKGGHDVCSKGISDHGADYPAEVEMYNE
jgi:hypothetical protein